MEERSQLYKIGFDMDGVIIDHTNLRIVLAKKYGFSLTPEQTQSDVLCTIIPKTERSALQNTLYNDPKMALSAPLMKGAYKGISTLINEGFLIYLISRRKDPELAIKLLSTHGLWPDYFNKENTFFVAEIEDKNEKAKEFGLTHYIDDEEKVLEVLTGVPNKILFDQYNTSKNKLHERVNGWDELVSYFLKLN
jgi:5'(3')-deoxyribonucleotidase